MLVQAAMNTLGDSTRSNYSISNGVITHTPSGQTLTYGSLASAAAVLPPPSSAPLVPDAEFRLIGKTVPRVDIPNKVDGSAQYGLDIRLPNMVYAVIKHSPAFGGTLAVAPFTPSGMIAVVPTRVVAGVNRGAEATGNFNAVAVVGNNTWDTWQASKSLQVSWNLPAGAASMNSTQFQTDAQALLTSATPYVAGAPNPPGTLYTVEGSSSVANAAIDTAPIVVDSTYTLPYVAHACMEVLNCTVDYVPGVKCDVYAPTQSAKTVLNLAVALTGLNANQINVYTTYLGGGLGRKAEVDFVSQAIQVGMALGRPVKLMWPREEDFTHDQYRPMALIHARAGVTSTGIVQGWSYRNVSPSILAQRGAVLGTRGDSQGIEGAQSLPYNFGARVTEYVTHPSPIPVGFWRSVGASLNTFGVESMVDELAAAAGWDPYLFRRALLTDPRWVAVLDAAAQLGNWFSAPPSGRARGIAIGTAFNSIVAEVVEVSNATSTSLRVDRVSIALDSYLTVNPGQVESQLTGGMVHGLNAALYGQQTFVNGVAQAKNFKNSRMIRLSEMPQVSVKIIPNPSSASRSATIGGVGELGVPTFAPALANAYFRLTGKRIRTLPLFPNSLMGGL
jgi:isoquinoline 1-oxidoreductase beta subunit